MCSLCFGNIIENESSIISIQNNISAGYLDKAILQCNALMEQYNDSNSYEFKRAVLLAAEVYEGYGDTEVMNDYLSMINSNDENDLIRYYWTDAFAKYSFLIGKPRVGIDNLSLSIEIGRTIKNNDRVKYNCWFSELFTIYYSESIEKRILNGEELPPRVYELFGNLKVNEGKMQPFELAKYYSYQIYFTNSLNYNRHIQLSNKIIQFGIKNDQPVAIVVGKLNLAKHLDSEKKINVLMEAEKQVSQIQTLRKMLEVRYDLMIYYKDEGDYDNAIKWGKKACFPGETDYSNYFDTYGQISELYEQRGDIDSALYYKKIDYNKYQSVSRVHDEAMQSFFIEKLNKNIEDKKYEIRKNHWFIWSLSITSIAIILLAFRNLKINKILQSKNQSLESSLQTTENFSHILSHDLRAPMYSIKNVSSYLIEDEKTISKDGQESLGIIKECCENSILLITNIMTYIQSKDKEVSTSRVELAVVFKQAEINLNEIIETSGATIKYGELPQFINGNKVLLVQLIQNVFQNAIKYRKDDIPMLLEVSYQKSNSNGTIVISDNGIGIKESQIQSLLKAFSQKEFVSVESGIGLGLSICSNIMKHHKGKFLIESEEGVGTSVKLQFELDNFAT